MDKLSPLQFVLPIAGTLDPDFVRDILRQFPVPVNVVREEIYDVIAVSDVAIVASGTATLETALLETPMVVVYKVSASSYADRPEVHPRGSHQPGEYHRRKDRSSPS